MVLQKMDNQLGGKFESYALNFSAEKTRYRTYQKRAVISAVISPLEKSLIPDYYQWVFCKLSTWNFYITELDVKFLVDMQMNYDLTFTSLVFIFYLHAYHRKNTFANGTQVKQTRHYFK